jgi:peptidoglycan-associated lipoprotein
LTPAIDRRSSLYGREDLRQTPVMQFKSRTVDFGKVKKGEKREHVYSFTNEGDTPLEVELISACDCTEVFFEYKTYKPGESGLIRIVFDSAEKDEAEVIDIDILLKNTFPGTDIPIIERLAYSFDIIK